MKDCPYCDKTGLLILPLRYAAVVDGAPKSLVPPMPATLGKGVSDISLTHGQYAPRLLREGYLYTLIQRAGIKYWEAYAITEDAFLYKFAPNSPPSSAAEFSCDQTSCGIDASCIAIEKVESVDKVFFLFSPAALTPDVLNDYKANAETYAGKGKLQSFNPKTWAKSEDANQSHSLNPALLTQHVPEWKLYAQGSSASESELGKLMQRQMFPAIKAAFAGVLMPEGQSAPGRLGKLQQKLQEKKGAAFVVFDHIGIAQELNDFRNAALAGMEDYLAATDEYGTDNQWRLQSYEAIQDVKSALLSGIAQRTTDALARQKLANDNYFENQRNAAERMRRQGYPAEAAIVEAELNKSMAERDAAWKTLYAKTIADSKERAAKTWRDDYENRLDVTEMEKFYGTLQSHLKKAFAAVDARTAQHLAWFESDRLVNAFDVFDPKNQVAGYAFALHSALCTFGISGARQADEKLDTWIKGSATDRKNLYLRGVYNNQEELLRAAQQANEELQAAAGNVELASAISPALVIKATKGLVDGFKKVDSAFDEWARNQGQSFSTKWASGREIVLYHKMSEMTRTVFRSGIGGTFDKVLTARISGVLYARIRAVTEKIAYDEILLTLPKEKVAEHKRARAERRAEQLRADKAGTKASKLAGQIEGSLEDLVADAQSKAQAKVKLTLDELKGNKSLPTNNYHQTRIGVVLGCIEMIALGEKLSHFENNTKGWFEVGGSVMAVTSIVMDTYYSAAKSIREIQPYKGIDAINKSADIVRGKFKLWAGITGNIAGGISAYFDYVKWRSATDPVLSWVYGLRAATGTASVAFGAAAAFSYAQPFLRYSATAYAKSTLRYRTLWAAGEVAGKLVARVRLLVWVARLNLVGLALTAVEIGYLLLKDNELQNWMEKCAFRREKRTTGWISSNKATEKFNSMQVEIEELEKSSQAIGLGSM